MPEPGQLRVIPDLALAKKLLEAQPSGGRFVAPAPGGLSEQLRPGLWSSRRAGVTGAGMEPGIQPSEVMEPSPSLFLAGARPDFGYRWYGK